MTSRRSAVNRSAWNPSSTLLGASGVRFRLVDHYHRRHDKNGVALLCGVRVVREGATWGFGVRVRCEGAA